MEVEEVAGLLVDGFLEALLCNGISWHVADSSGRDVILGKGIDKSLADFGGICYLSGRRWPSRISEPMLECAIEHATGILTVELPEVSETLVARFECLFRIASNSRMPLGQEVSAEYLPRNLAD